MKMYEKLGMSTEDALKWVEECAKRNCLDCPAYKIAQRTETIVVKCASSYLLSDAPEPPKVPRWKTAKTRKDIDKIFSDFDAMCRNNRCDKCKYETFRLGDYPIPSCFYCYILELVDAPESEDENG